MIVVDIEASGVDAEEYSLLSIGAVEYEAPERRFYSECGVWPGAKIDSEALKVNGFKGTDITDPSKESEAVLIAAFTSWALEAKEITLAGHNVMFDYFFLRAAAKRAGLNWPFPYRVIDSHSLYYMHLVGGGRAPEVTQGKRHIDLSATEIFTACGLPPREGAHNALDDALLTTESISRLTRKQKLLTEYEEFSIPFVL